jgi:hypothetical protein
LNVNLVRISVDARALARGIKCVLVKLLHRACRCHTPQLPARSNGLQLHQDPKTLQRVQIFELLRLKVTKSGQPMLCIVRVPQRKLSYTRMIHEQLEIQEIHLAERLLSAR